MDETSSRKGHKAAELHFCVMITEKVHLTFAVENEMKKGITANLIIHIGEQVDWFKPL